jgi:hypothetical protein
MGQQVRAGDELLMMHDYTFAAGTTGATGAHNGTAIDLGAADVDEEHPGEIVVELDSMTSGGSATVAITVQDSADNSTFAAITPITIAVMALAFDSAVWAENGGKLRIPLPAYGTRRYLRIVLTIATATVTGGTARIYFARTPR